jgi:hypothetical protein
MARRGKDNDGKYLRLTGLWPSKNNDSLFTGRLRPEDLEKLGEKLDEAIEAEAPLVFSLWENKEKESRKDPEFSLQCFVGEADDKPSSRRGKSSRDEEPERGRGRKGKDEEPEEEEEETTTRRGKKETGSTRRGKKDSKGW